MATPDKGQKTEKPTQHRLQKARKEGRFPANRDFISAVQFLAALWVAIDMATGLRDRFSILCITLFRSAFVAEAVTQKSLGHIYRSVVFPTLLLLVLWGLGICLLIAVVQFASTGFGLAFKQLAPDFQRLSISSRLQQLPGQNLESTIRAMLLIPLAAYLLWIGVRGEIDNLGNLASGDLFAGIMHAGDLIKRVIWRMGFILLAFGLVDFFRQRKKFARQMSMTKQEVRDEMKEMEGNPQMKLRIRRLQRDAARRNMMKAVSQASVVIVNPTHYAIAIRYEMNSKSVPVVLAKGKNYLAQLIKARATQYEVPIVENKPLAQALYSAVDVGQEIPPNLYRAVAEVLAHIYRTLNRSEMN